MYVAGTSLGVNPQQLAREKYSVKAINKIKI